MPLSEAPRSLALARRTLALARRGLLQVWLAGRGGFNDMADRLGVHPQTVRYRMNQVGDLLGSRLDDPGERLMLQMALHATQNLAM